MISPILITPDQRPVLSIDQLQIDYQMLAELLHTAHHHRAHSSKGVGDHGPTRGTIETSIRLVLRAGAHVHGLGDKDQAFQWLERAFEERSEMIPMLKIGADFDDLRSDPRLHNLIRRCGLETKRIRAVRN